MSNNNCDTSILKGVPDDGAFDYSKKLASYSTSEFGVPIILHDTAVLDDDGDIHIPHHDKLMTAAAVYRCTLPRRLNGKEMKFIRKAMNKSATVWARHLSTDKSTLSRWESNKQPMSVNAEKPTPDVFPEMRFVLCKFRKDELYTNLQDAA